MRNRNNLRRRAAIWGQVFLIGTLVLAMPFTLTAAKKKKEEKKKVQAVIEPKKTYDVRHVTWDMDREQVMDVEQEAVLVTEEKVNTSGSRLIYHTQYPLSQSRKPEATLSYYFSHQKLAMASYQLPPEAEFSYDQIPAYIKNYESLKASLISEYGRPDEDLAGASANNLGVNRPTIDKVAVWDSYRSKIFLILFEGRVRLIYQKRNS
jgi:hypothetical protein